MYDPTKPSTDSVLKLIQKTWKTPYLKIEPGTYAIFKRKFNYPEVDHTDGIGTKGMYHWQKKSYRNAVIDALAMNLNDLLLVRATAFKIQNHLVLPSDNKEIIVEIMKALVYESEKRSIAVTGGETSIHGLKDNFDIGITVSGFIEKPVPNKAQTGDVVLALKSSGLHSNGFTFIKKLFKEEFREEFIKPTNIYYDILNPLLKKIEINGMMHVTGGAFSKLKGIINKNQDILITNPITPQKIFYDIYKKGLTSLQMYKTFNCGMGFILTVPENKADKIIDKVPSAEKVGKVCKGKGIIKLVSSFDKSETII